MAFPLAGVYYIRRTVGGAGIYANTVGPGHLLSGTDVMVSTVCFEDDSAIFSAHAISSGGWNISKVMPAGMNEPAFCPKKLMVQLRATWVQPLS